VVELPADAGSTVAPKVMLGDDLLAIHKIHEEPAVKPHHGTLGNSNWAYKVYLTTFALNPDGTPLLHVVTDLTTTQVLIVRPDQTLVEHQSLTSFSPKCRSLTERDEAQSS